MAVAVSLKAKTVKMNARTAKTADVSSPWPNEHRIQQAHDG